MKNLLLIGLCLPVLFSCGAPKKTAATGKAASLQGAWVLDRIPYTRGTFESLYPDARPELSFDVAGKHFSGSTGCNRINGPLVGDARAISFKGDMAVSLMACAGDGEAVFLENLRKVNRYSVSADGSELTLIQGDIALMHFHKKTP